MDKPFGTRFKKSLPVMAGYLVLGMGFGMMLEAGGIWNRMGACHEYFYLCGLHAVCCYRSFDGRCVAHHDGPDDGSR